MWIARLVYTQVDSAGHGQCVKSVGNKIGKDLPHLARKAKNAVFTGEVSGN